MNESTAAQPMPSRRWPAVAASALLGVLATVAVGESLGWPFLAAPLQRLLSDQLDRRVSFSADAALVAPSDSFSVRFVGGLRLRTAHLRIDAPPWSAAPHLLLAREVALEMRYVDLWRARRGERLRIHRLRADRLDGQLERLADGRASWQFGARPVPQDEPLQPLIVPWFGRLQVAAGTLQYRDVPLAIDVGARLSLVDAKPPAAAPEAFAAVAGAPRPQPATVLHVDAAGTYRKLPLKLALLASGQLPWVADEAVAAPVPLTLNATVGRARLAFQGSAMDALHLSGLSGRFTLSGPSLAAVGDPVGVTLPTTAAFRSAGLIVKHGETWQVLIEDATIGASRLTGAFTYETGRALPLLSGRLGGSRLMLVDLGPVVGTLAAAPAASASVGTIRVAPAPTRAKGRVLPDRPFDLQSLRAMDANVLIHIADVDLNTRLLEPLRPLRAHLQLAQGVLTLNDLDARTAQGRLMGALRLDGRGSEALWNADLRWDGVRLERWIHLARSDGAPPFVSGRLSGQAKLQGEGRSTAQILGSLRGRARTELRDGAVSHLVIEAAGLDLAQGLGVMLKGDDALPVECAVADLVALGGVFRPRVMVLDTSDSAVWIDGSLSLATEALDLRVVVSPKDFSPLAVRTPLHVRGSLAHPEVSLEKGPMGRKLATAFLLALVNPLAALIPLIDPGDGDTATSRAASCHALTQRSANPRSAGRKLH